ncbi:hypothetical protein PIB30_054068 [Stylosanthes scabra]|uniref:Ubiquitin-like protease family profile domain-containing protein n=1 Tax=Stylosanthes scabra TaxID=79078 RepID=A0ABU6VIW4_9FABA|nr:hypothetical protein [Stylosanthes scabra]
MRHETMNAEPIQPPQHDEAELNVAATIVDPPTNSFSLPTDTGKDAAAAMEAEEEALNKELTTKDITPRPVAVPREPVTGASAAAPMDDTANDAVDGPAAMEVEEEALTTELTTQHIITQSVIVLALEKHGEKESMAVPREPVMEELTLRDLPEKKSTSQAVIVLALEKYGDKESVAVPREPVLEELTLRDLPEKKSTTNDDATSAKIVDQPPIVPDLPSSSAPAKEDAIPTNKEVQRQMDLGVSIVAEMVTSGDYLDFTQPSFDLGSEFGSQATLSQVNRSKRKVTGGLEKLDGEEKKLRLKIAAKKLENILKMEEELSALENFETPQKLETSRTRIYRWATECTNTNQYSFLFNFKTSKPYQAMRDHFMSLAQEAEMDLVNGMLGAYHHNYIDPQIQCPYSITTLANNNDSLDYIDKDKMEKARYQFALVLYENHWWLYVINVKGKRVFVLDSKNIKNPSGERMKLNRFASNVLNQMLVYAGRNTMFPGPITRQVATHSLLHKYVTIPKQPNQLDCGVYVLKYMKIVNPSDLGKSGFRVPAWSKEQLEDFREQFVERILSDVNNEFLEDVMEVAKPNARHPIPSRAIQSSYVQL